MMARTNLAKGNKMENQIRCPKCNRTISNDPIIDSAARKEYARAGSLTCDCGERISFWAITAQLRKQKTLGSRIRTWLRPFSEIVAR
jgi:hypothetical protein